MSLELIHTALAKGAKIYASVSGGKDGQAMTASMHRAGLPIAGLIHADLGRMEWHESLPMCEQLSREIGAPLHVVRRTDGRDLIDHIESRMHKLAGTGKPIWPSSDARYCTSDLKREPINKFFRNCGHDLVISCEGIRGSESKERAKKSPLTIRKEITSTYYAGMTVEEAIEAYLPGKRLALTWYPIFHYTTADVWATYGMNENMLTLARKQYAATGIVPAGWKFHPAYAYGNERVSCVFCVLGCAGDLTVGKKHRPELHAKLVSMELESGTTFKNKFSLTQL